MTWQGMETAPQDGTPFLAAISVKWNDYPRHWRIYVVAYDGIEGEMNSDYESGWDFEDYAYWKPLPAVPEQSQC